MPGLVATVGVHNAFHVGLLLTAFGFGFRHGIDWDHIAALTDITSSQEEPRRSMWFATLYALGHALVVFLLGFTAIVLAQRLPEGVDAVMERLVGATLLILGCYVFYALARHGRDFRMRSRWMLIFSGVRRGVQWLRAGSARRASWSRSSTTMLTRTPIPTISPISTSMRERATTSWSAWAPDAPRGSSIDTRTAMSFRCPTIPSPTTRHEQPSGSG